MQAQKLFMNLCGSQYYKMDVYSQRILKWIKNLVLPPDLLLGWVNLEDDRDSMYVTNTTPKCVRQYAELWNT